jgi:hypothetical protein
MRSQLPANVEALLGRTIFPRDFMEIRVKARDTGAFVTERLWSDRYDVNAAILDLDTGIPLSYTWQGAAGLIEISDLSFVSNLTVSEATVSLAAYGVDVDRLLRQYDAAQARVRIWRGFLDVETRQLVAPAEPIYTGEVDDIQLPTGADGEEAVATLTILASQELTRGNPETRSHSSQLRRNPNDDFFKYAATVGQWVMWWGQKRGVIPAESATERAKQAAAVIESYQ